jgi:hypothetical protein
MASRVIVALTCIIAGLVITGISGLFPAPFSPIQIDIVEHGSPLSWSSRVIPTQFITLNWANFTIDLLFWSIFIYIIIAAAKYFREKGSTSND